MVRPKEQNSPLIVARLAKPGSIRAFLRSNGFRQIEPAEKGNRLADLFVGKGRRLIVPRNSTAPDYDRCVLQIAEAIARAPITVVDLLTAFALPPMGIFKYRLADPATHLGVAPLSTISEAIVGIFEMLRFSAASVASAAKPQTFTNISSEAKVFADGCQLGQTERGSFVIKVFCPLNPLNLSKDITGPPLGEQALQACRENASFLAMGKPNDPRPATLTKNFVDGFVKTRPSTQFGSVELDIVTDSINTRPRNKTLIIDAIGFERASQIATAFESEHLSSPEVFTGYITDLHRDPPGSKEINRAVSIRVRYGDGERTIRLALTGLDYTNAVRWHDREQAVILRCVVNRRSHQWTVDRLFEFRPSEADLPSGLFAT